jgi:hypothetical protein
MASEVTTASAHSPRVDRHGVWRHGNPSSGKATQPASVGSCSAISADTSLTELKRPELLATLLAELKWAKDGASGTLTELYQWKIKKCGLGIRN